MIRAPVAVARNTRSVVDNKCQQEGALTVIWEVELPDIQDRLEELQRKVKEMGVYL